MGTVDGLTERSPLGAEDLEHSCSSPITPKLPSRAKGGDGRIGSSRLLFSCRKTGSDHVRTVLPTGLAGVGCQE